MVTGRRCFAIFDIREPVDATRLYNRFDVERNRILLRGPRRGACRLSPGLHSSGTGQHLLQGVVERTYVDVRFPRSFGCNIVDDSLPTASHWHENLSGTVIRGGGETAR